MAKKAKIKLPAKMAKIPKLVDMPKPVQTGIVTGAAILGVIGAVMIIKNFRQKAFEREIMSIPSPDGSERPQLTRRQADVVASSLWNAMKGIGTNVQALTYGQWGNYSEDGTFTPEFDFNAKDLQLIFARFGMRRYFIYGHAAILGSKKDLYGWFRAELSNKDYNEIAGLWSRLSGIPAPGLKL